MLILVYRISLLAYSYKIRVSITYLIKITLINNKKLIFIETFLFLWFLIFTEIAKLNTSEMFCNDKIAQKLFLTIVKFTTFKVIVFSTKLIIDTLGDTYLNIFSAGKAWNKLTRSAGKLR